MDMQCGIAAQFLRRILDNEMRPLNAVVRDDVFTRIDACWTAPRKPSLVKLGFDLRHPGSRRVFVDYACPFGYYVEQHGPLPLVHSGSLQPFRENRFAILPWTEYQISETIAQNRLLPLGLVQSLQQSESLVALLTE